MTRPVRSTTWLVTLALAAAAAAGAAAGPSPCLGVDLVGERGPALFADGFESGDTSRWGQPAPPAFSTVANADLGVAVEIDPATTGEHLLELRWRLPGGDLYQSVAVPFSDAEASGPRRVRGYPFPLEVARLGPLDPGRVAGDEGRGVESRLPLAGTSIADSALWGEWTLEVWIDRGAEPCLPPLPFRIEP